MTASSSIRVGGTIVCQARDILRETCGAEVFEPAVASVPEPVREEYLSATPISWVRVSTLEAVVGACAARCGRDPLDLNDEVSRLGTERAFGTVWRVFLRFTTDAALISRTPVIYAKTYDRGRIVPRITQPGVAEVDLVELPSPPEFMVRGLGTGIQTTLRCAGRDDARVRVESTADGVRYHCRWAPSALRSASFARGP